MKKTMAIIASLMASSMLLAQDGADVMESNGRFYVVIAVILAMFIGILIFLFILDKKLSNLERQIKS